MKTKIKVKRIDFSGKDLFIGVDVHKKKWSVLVRTKELELQSFSMNEPTPEKLHRTLEKNFPGAIYHIVYEAGFSGYSLYDYFHERGIDIMVTPPNRIPDDRSRVKTDRRDSRKLAKYLSQGILKSVVVPDKDVRELRYIFNFWDKMKKNKTGTVLQIKSLLDFLDHDLKKEKWNKGLIDKLEKVRFREEKLERVLKLMLDYYRYSSELEEEIGSIISEIGNDERYSDKVDRIFAIKGVGIQTAIRFVLKLFDRDDRFENGEGLAHYLGLTPSEHSSGENERKGGITYNGDPELRALVIQIAWQVVRDDVALMDKFEAVNKRSGSRQKAIVAVARKFMMKIHAMMSNGEPYVKGVA